MENIKKIPGLEEIKCCGGKKKTAVGPEQGYYWKQVWLKYSWFNSAIITRIPTVNNSLWRR